MRKFTTFFALLISLYAFSQPKMENLMVNWPEEYKWKIVTNHETDQMHFIELIPENENVEEWTIIGTMISVKGITGLPMDVAVNMMYEQTKVSAPKAKLTVIEKNETDKNHWVIFKIESPNFKNEKKPESQLYYIIQGDSSLYSNFVAKKENRLSANFVNKWAEIFKTSELVYQ